MKVLSGFLAALLFFTAAGVFAQPGSAPDPDGDFMVTRTEHFEIYSSPDDALNIARKLEVRFAVYNQFFRFDPAKAVLPLRVKVFGDRELYNSYVESRLGTVPSEAVYLHYGQADQRELLLCQGGGNEAGALPYQAFIQFIKAFIPNPPLWIQEGFAVSFATLVFNETEDISYSENLAWLDAVKSMEKPPSPAEIMLQDGRERPENFQGLAWSLVSFFMYSGESDYLRSLTESFMLLSGTKTAEENAETVMRHITTWNSMEKLTEDYIAYLHSRKTFNELISDGRQAYDEGRPRNAETAFLGAMELRPAHYAPWYYLGLLAYEGGDTDAAGLYYSGALNRGADAALVNYSLALNSIAAGNNSEAVGYLRLSAAAPGSYREKAEALIARLDK